MERYGKEVIWTLVKLRCSLMDAMTETENPERLAATPVLIFPATFAPPVEERSRNPTPHQKRTPLATYPCCVPTREESNPLADWGYRVRVNECNRLISTVDYLSRAPN